MTIPVVNSHVVTESAIPTIPEAATVPWKLPSPPMMTTTNAYNSTSMLRRTLGPQIGSHINRTPPTAASPVPTPKTTVNACRTSIPSACTISVSSLPARMYSPYSVRVRNSQTATRMMAPMTTSNR